MRWLHAAGRSHCVPFPVYVEYFRSILKCLATPQRPHRSETVLQAANGPNNGNN